MKHFLPLAVFVLSGCSVVSEIAYDETRYSATKKCEAYPAQEQRNECLRKVIPPRGEYEKQRQSALIGRNENDASQKEDEAKRSSNLCFKRQATGEVVCPN